MCSVAGKGNRKDGILGQYYCEHIVSKGYGNGSDLPKHGLQLAGEAEHELSTNVRYVLFSGELSW